MPIDLEDLEDKLSKMFNEVYDARNNSSTSQEDIERKVHASTIANTLLNIRQQRQFENGETRVIQSNAHRNIRTYVKKRQQ